MQSKIWIYLQKVLMWQYLRPLCMLWGHNVLMKTLTIFLLKYCIYTWNNEATAQFSWVYTMLTRKDSLKSSYFSTITLQNHFAPSLLGQSFKANTSDYPCCSLTGTLWTKPQLITTYKLQNYFHWDMENEYPMKVKSHPFTASLKHMETTNPRTKVDICPAFCTLSGFWAAVV